MFINRLLIKHSQCEVTLERLRCDVFDRLKYYDDDFPYGLQCELKRRVLISPNYVVRTGTETVVSHTSTMSDTSLTVVSEQRNEGSAQCDLNTDGSIDSLPLGHDNASHVHNDTCLN